MSLDLGTLVGYLNLDDKGFDKVLDGLPNKIKGSGVVMMAGAALVAAGVGTAISQGIGTAIDLDDASHKITAQLGLTEAESARIGGIAGKLYSQAYGESIEEVNSAVGSVVSSIEGMRDATSEALELMTAKALNFGTTFEVDVARTTQVVGQLIKGGLVKDANEGFDLLTAAMQKVPAAIREDLLDALDEYAPFMQSIGITGEEAFGLLVKSAEKGMYGIDKTGDALKEFTIRATDMSSASKVGYDALGFSQEEMTNKILAGGETAAGAFDQIVAGLQDIADPAARSQAALALFGTPLEDLGVNEIPKFLASLQGAETGMEDAAGAADRMGESINGSAKVGFEELNRSWEAIVGTLGQFLVPLMQELVTVLNDNPALLQVVAAAVGILALAFVALTVATWAMNTALLANPITWIILGIVALIAAIVLLVANWDQVVTFLGNIWAVFVDWFVLTMNGLLVWWGETWDGFIGMLGDASETIINNVAGFLSWVLDMFLTWTLLGVVIRYWDDIVSGITNAWLGFISWIMTSLNNFVGAWGHIWNTVAGFASRTWTNLVNGAASMVSSMIAFIQGIPQGIINVFLGAGSWLFNAGRDLVNGLLGGVKSLASTIGSFFLKLLPSWIVTPFKAALGIKSPSKLFAEYAGNMVDGLFVGFDDHQGELDGRVRDLVTLPPVKRGSGAPGAADGTVGTESGKPQVLHQAVLDMRGAHVGWNPDEVKERMDKQASIASSLSGIDEEVPVA